MAHAAPAIASSASTARRHRARGGEGAGQVVPVPRRQQGGCRRRRRLEAPYGKSPPSSVSPAPARPRCSSFWRAWTVPTRAASDWPAWRSRVHRRHRDATAPPRGRVRLPVVQPDPRPVRAGQHRPAVAPGRPGRRRATAGRAGRTTRHRQPSGPRARTAVRRPEAASGSGQGVDRRAGDRLRRRAHRCPRRRERGASAGCAPGGGGGGTALQGRPPLRRRSRARRCPRTSWCRRGWPSSPSCSPWSVTASPAGGTSCGTRLRSRSGA